VEEKHADKLKREVLQGIAARSNREIEREVQPDGSVLYFHPLGGGPENVYRTDLFSALMEPINHFESLIDHLSDEEYGSFGEFGRLVANDAEQRFGELCHFLEEAIGDIRLDVMGRKSHPYRPGRILAAKVTPREVAK
jgi:hypothetical protein